MKTSFTLILKDIYFQLISNSYFSIHRYLKSVFPTVEEYLLLDVLSNSDNNVQKAADKLVKMGYVKRDTPSKKLVLESLEILNNKGIIKNDRGVVYDFIIDY